MQDTSSIKAHLESPMSLLLQKDPPPPPFILARRGFLEMIWTLIPKKAFGDLSRLLQVGPLPRFLKP